jgi:cytochrome P450
MGEHSLVLVQEPRHKYLRGLLQPAFSGSAIAGYLPAIQGLVTRHLAEWEAAGEAGMQGYDGLKLLTYEFIISVSVELCSSWCCSCFISCAK